MKPNKQQNTASYLWLLKKLQVLGTEKSRTPSSITSTKQCNQFEVWVFLSDHFTSWTQQEPHETPAPSNVAKWQLLQSTLKKPTYFILI